MFFVGITGGVGAGKSAILSYLADRPGTRVLLADEIAHELMEPGTEVYWAIRCAFAEEDILRKTQEVSQNENAPFDRGKLAAVIFSDPDKRKALNAIVHPAVKNEVCRIAKEEREKGSLRLLVLEAALLIEEGYDTICDELWYVYTAEETRRERLRATRGYSDAKIDAIFDSQLKEAEFRAHTQVEIDNNGILEETLEQIERELRYKC